jgi:hypothetical protein
MKKEPRHLLSALMRLFRMLHYGDKGCEQMMRL